MPNILVLEVTEQFPERDMSIFRDFIREWWKAGAKSPLILGEYITSKTLQIDIERRCDYCGQINTSSNSCEWCGGPSGCVEIINAN